MEINKNDCKYLDKVFINYLNESLSDTDKEFCKTHLNSCNDCKNKEEYQELIYVWNKLDLFNEVELPNFFMAKLQHKIVGIEEKSKIFWFRMDYIFSLLKGPMLALTFIAVNITNTISFAEPHLYEKLRSKDTFLENKFNSFKNMTINEALTGIIKVSKQAKEAK